MPIIAAQNAVDANIHILANLVILSHRSQLYCINTRIKLLYKNIGYFLFDNLFFVLGNHLFDEIIVYLYAVNNDMY